MTFTIDNWDAISASVSNNVTAWYSYKNLSDTIATILASGYFNNRITANEVGDVIHIQGSDDHALVRITSVTTNVTVEQYIDTPSILDSAVTQVKIAPSSLNGTVVANGTGENPIGIIPLIFRIAAPGGGGVSKDIVMNHNILITDVWVINEAGGSTGDTIQIQTDEGASITDAIDVNKVDTIVTYAGFIFNANSHIRVAESIRLVQVDGGDSDSPIATVYVLAWREA